MSTSVLKAYEHQKIPKRVRWQKVKTQMKCHILSGSVLFAKTLSIFSMCLEIITIIKEVNHDFKHILEMHTFNNNGYHVNLLSLVDSKRPSQHFFSLVRTFLESNHGLKCEKSTKMQNCGISKGVGDLIWPLNYRWLV